LLVAAVQEAAAADSPIAVGGSHTCAINSDGAANCWGANNYGQLGDDSLDPSSATPVQVEGLASGVSKISSGYNHTCVVTSGGTAKCWGLNDDGQLGDDSIISKSAPVDVDWLTDITAISAGGSHTCAVVGGQDAYCWGNNYNGQLGDTTNDDRDQATLVQNLPENITAITTGSDHSCAIAGGKAFCWGYGYYGQLGDDGSSSRNTPYEITSLSTPVAAISAGGSHTCAIDSTGAAKCWGRSHFGQLGDDTYTTRREPTGVNGLGANVTDIVSGYNHTCAIDAAGATKCWGRNISGQLGDGTTTDRKVPTPVSGFGSDVTSISAGTDHTCAVRAGAARCWGGNAESQLGTGLAPISPKPVQVSGLGSGVSAISAGSAHSCAIVSGGGARCWGSGSSGELGDVAEGKKSTPFQVPGWASGVSAISAGDSFTCAAVSSPVVARCWGRGSEGQTGNGTYSSVVAPGSGLVSPLADGVTAVSAGFQYACAIVGSPGAAHCWGIDDMGRLGDGPGTDSNTPSAVTTPPSGLTAIAAGNQHTCAVKSDGSAWCWGRNDNGALGLGDDLYENKPSPTAVPAMASGVTAIDVGYSHSCAVKSDGSAWCWGLNDSGQLGDDSNSMPDTDSPSGVYGLGSGVSAITSGAFHSCAIVNGGAWCWGDNDYGQLGDTTTTDRDTPVLVDGLASGVTAISAGPSHTCAIVGGAAKCWGDGTSGALGNGSAFASTPASVPGFIPFGGAADTTDPAVTITAPAAGSTLATATPSIVFNVVEADPSTSTECKVDAGAFVSCTSPWLTPSLSDGAHSATVQAEDSSGNVGTATVNFTIATSQPGGPGGGGPGGGGPGGAQPAPQITSAPKKAKLGKAIKLKVSCPAGCMIAPQLKIGKKTVRGVKALTVKPGASSVSFKLPKKVVKKIKKALKKNKRTKVTLKLTPSSGASKGTAKSVRIR
jgi:alpha-tubulin suppressor-like RCC1 family protein